MRVGGYPLFRIGVRRLAVGGAALAGLSLAFVVGKAVFFGLFTPSLPFVRTPTCEAGAPWTAILGMVRMELLLLMLTAQALGSTRGGEPAPGLLLGSLTPGDAPLTPPKDLDLAA